MPLLSFPDYALKYKSVRPNANDKEIDEHYENEARDERERIKNEGVREKRKLLEAELEITRIRISPAPVSTNQKEAEQLSVRWSTAGPGSSNSY